MLNKFTNAVIIKQLCEKFKNIKLIKTYVNLKGVVLLSIRKLVRLNLSLKFFYN